MIGMPADVEIEAGDGFRDITPDRATTSEPEAKPAKAKAAKQPDPVVEDAETVEEARPKAAEEPKAEEKKPEPEKANGKAAKEAPPAMRAFLSMWASLIRILESEIADSAPEDVDAVLDSYSLEIEGLRGALPDEHARIMGMARVKVETGSDAAAMDG